MRRGANDYVMYLSRNTGNLYTDGRQEPVSLFFATSSDGVSWTINPNEMLGLGSSSQWDYNKVETPSVIYHAGTYHLYYCGGSETGANAGRYLIGHAATTSLDGVSGWTKDSDALLTPASVAAATGTQNILHVGEPGAVVFNNGSGDKIYLYFTVTSERSGGAGPSSQMAIYLAVLNTDGTTISRIQKVLEQTASYPASSGWNGYSTPSALVNAKNQIELYYDVYFHTANTIAGDEQVRLQRAVSQANDGTIFSEDSAPLMCRANQNWTAREIRGGSQLIEGGTVKMWFAGDNYTVTNGTWGGGMNFGLATWSEANGPYL